MLTALESPPKPLDPLFWTDFAELRALVHPDQCYSRGDLLGLINRTGDTEGRQRSKSGDAEARWRSIKDFAQVRSTEFEGAYPFHVTDDGDTLELAANTSREQNAYLCLLLSSLMRHVPKRRQGELARFFEEASHAVFRHLMPAGAEVHPTWASGGKQARYQGTLYEKMLALAKDIRCTANFQARDFKENDRGDGGIDLVAWHPMADQREGIPIAFAQCGCSKEDWTFKQLEASPFKHGSHLPARHPWATYYFMPLDLRHSDGDWAYKSDIGQAIIVDRLRLIRLSRQYGLFAEWPELPLLREVREVRYA